MKTKHLFLKINLLLGLVILVLLNLIAQNSYFKADLTGNNAYSLSQVSKDTLAQIEDPLRVKVFYNSQIPAPYNSVRRYLQDLLREYNARQAMNFNYEFVDPTTPEGKQQAQQYGLQQVEIQEIKSDQFQSKAVYMGAVVLYGNVVERVDNITGTNGLEYRLTTAMRSAITQVDALSGADEKVQMKVIASPVLQQLQIQGFADLRDTMVTIHQKVNTDNYNRIEFEYLKPDTEKEIAELSSTYDIQPISWEDRSGEKTEALLDVVLSYQDNKEIVPLRILSGLLGGYSLQKPEAIEEAVRQGLKSLVSANPRIAYVTGQGEKALDDSQRGAGAFSSLLQGRFELVEVNPGEDPIPGDIDTLIINGPTEKLSKEALYRIDQFVMQGGSLFVMLDSHVQKMPSQRQMMAGTRPTWEKNTTGLEQLLNAWGVDVTPQLVLDEESYVARQGMQSQQLFQAPVLTGDSLNRENVITAELDNIILLNVTEIRPVSEQNSAQKQEKKEDEADSEYPEITTLLTSSPESWTVESPQEVTPYLEGAPASAETERKTLAVLLQGNFNSSFDGPLQLELQSMEKAQSESAKGTSTKTVVAEGPTSNGESPAGSQIISTAGFRSSSDGKGKVALLSTSAVTTAQLLNPQQRTPNSTFLMNTIDYLNGAPGFAELRSKGLGTPQFELPSPAFRTTARWGNTILVPLLVVITGLFVWSRRKARSRQIQQMFNSDSEVAK